MYIKQAFKNKHDWWLYLAGLVLIVIAVILGQIPHTVALIAKALQLGLEFEELDPNKMMQLLESNLNLFLMLLSFAVGLLGLFIVVKYLHKQSIKSLTTSRSKIDWKRFWFAFLFWGFISVIIIMIDYRTSPENYVFNFELKPFLILVAIAVVLVPLQTSFEEYLFRGYLMQGIGVICKNKWVPLIVTSVLFGMLHIPIQKLTNLAISY